MGCRYSKSAVQTQDGFTAELAGPRDDDVTKQPPPIRPPTRTKNQVIPDPSVFQEVDNFVKKMDNRKASSLESLALTLTSPFKKDLLRIRAIFSWLAFNISYDTESSFSGNRSSQSADSVLQSRKAVCQGYAELFQTLCKIVSIHCILVSGIAKGYSHDPEAVYTTESETNHAWNLVLLDGEWRPLDSTWGAGHRNEGGQFVREFTEFWFLTDPEKFVMSHFPLKDNDLQQSRHYQLLAKPVTIQQYSASVNLKSHAQDMGLVCLTHDHTVVNVKGNVTIKVKATTRLLESVNVKLNERGSDTTQDKGSHVVTYMSNDGTCNIYVRPPRAATYLLDIYGTTEGEESSSLHQLLTYVIRCKKPANDVQPFPNKFGAWGVTLSARSQFGLRQDHNLTKLGAVIYKAKKGEATVSLSLNDSSTVTTNLRHALDDHDLEHHTMVEYTKQGISICARLPKPGYYTLKLFAKDKSAEGPLPHAGDFLLYSDTAQHECRPFPTVYGLAKDLRARLLEPRYGQVPAGQPTLYRVQVSGVLKMTIGGQKAELKNDGVWEATVTPGGDVTHLTVFAGLDDSKSLKGLYQFTVVQ